jgi:hypothetical protein
MPDTTGYVVKTVGLPGDTGYDYTNLQTAIDAAADDTTNGWIIKLKAGATFASPLGGYKLKVKSAPAGKWTIIRSESAAFDGGSLPPGTRVSPANASLMAKITTDRESSSDAQAIDAVAQAKYYRLIGIKVTIVPSVTTGGSLIQPGKGGSEQTAASQCPGFISIDRCYMHGLPAEAVFRGVAMNGIHQAVIESHFSEIHGFGMETHAIAGWNGPGPALSARGGS